MLLSPFVGSCTCLSSHDLMYYLCVLTSNYAKILQLDISMFFWFCGGHVEPYYCYYYFCCDCTILLQDRLEAELQ